MGPNMCSSSPVRVRKKRLMRCSNEHIVLMADLFTSLVRVMFDISFLFLSHLLNTEGGDESRCVLNFLFFYRLKVAFVFLLLKEK